MAGVPARQMGWVCECGKRLDNTLQCSCGRHYRHDPATDTLHQE